MSNQRKIKSEKEVNAVTLNQKEDRLLARTLKTLELENGYSSNLMALDYRTVKGNYKHLKERVSRIKSNLSTEEILELRRLEAEGKLKPDLSSFNLNAAMKIAAAARRLNLNPTPVKRARTAHSRHMVRPENGRLLGHRPTTATMKVRERSNSVTGVFMDAPEPDEMKRRNSIDGGITIRPHSAVNQAAPVAREEDSVKQKEKSRPSTSTGVDREKSSVSKVSLKPTANGLYSSHTMVEKDAALPNSSRTPREVKPSFMTDDVVETNLGADLYEERRQVLLHEELQFASTLESRKASFLGKVDDYLKVNPPVRFNVDELLKQPELVKAEEEEEESAEIIQAHSHRRRRFRRNLDYGRTYTSEEAYRQRGIDLWQGMNKTRYLRIPDDKIDLSGVVTLAKDQMKLFQILRSSEPSHLM